MNLANGENKIIKAREMALIIVFIAVSVALDPLRVPSVYLFGVYYRFCEIPIVAAFLLFGSKIGVTVAVINAIVEMLFFPFPAAIIGTPFVLLLTLSMLFGLNSASKLLKRGASQMNKGTRSLKYFTAFGAVFRTAAAPFAVYPLYRFVLPLVVAFSLSEAQLIVLIPAFMVYALTFSLYTIPIGYYIARTLSKNLKVGNPL